MRAYFLLAAATLIISGAAQAKGLDDAHSGAEALAAEEYQIAILHYTSAIRASDLPASEIALSYRQRGIAYFQTDRTDLAILDFTSALWLNGLDEDQTTKTYYNRGLAYKVLRETELAIADLTLAIERNPKYAEAYNSRGHIYRELGQYEQALADFTASHTQGNPEPHLPMYGMALTYEAMGRQDEAKAWYSRVLTVTADFEPALEKLHPDDLAEDVAPVPAIESDALLPSSETAEATSAAEPQLRGNVDEEVLEPSAPPAVAFTLDQKSQNSLAAAANKDGGPLVTESESQDTRPTLIDGPVPEERSGSTASAERTAETESSTRVASSVEIADARTGAPEPVTQRQRSGLENDTADEQQLAALSPATKPLAQPGVPTDHYEIQLGAYASPAIAESEAMRLKKDHADLLANMGYAVQRASVGTKTYFRLRGTGLSRADAIRLCKELRGRSISCVVSRP
jgi:tetratricopeptide (TPR) repeat protein